MNSSGEYGVHTTHSETHRPVHVPHPAPFSVPQYLRVGIPQPYPKYNYVRHKIEVPVYRVIPEIFEKPVPYTVEKPFPGRYKAVIFHAIATIQSIPISVEVERPFPVEVVKKLEIPVPKPYPVHVVYYNHISEDETPPPPPTPKTTSKPTRRPQSDYDFSSIFSSFKLPNLMDMFMPRKKGGNSKEKGLFDFEELYKNLLFEVPPPPPPGKKKTSSTKYGGEFSPNEHHEYNETKPR